MKIQFCGAAMGVTGSCHLITTEKHKILLDCGQFQGSKTREAMNYEPFPFDPAEIDYMILSHAHIDHCGRIPLLVKRGFKGEIYCTDATADLVEVMLKDSGYIHEKEVALLNQQRIKSNFLHGILHREQYTNHVHCIVLNDKYQALSHASLSVVLRYRPCAGSVRKLVYQSALAMALLRVQFTSCVSQISTNMTISEELSRPECVEEVAKG